MTAAHCADGAISARVVIGAHNVDQSESEAQEITASEFVVHELWSWNNLHNDIALIKLPEPAILSGDFNTAYFKTFDQVTETTFCNIFFEKIKNVQIHACQSDTQFFKTNVLKIYEN